MLYFSLTTLTTTGYGDIVPVDPFARSLAKARDICQWRPISRALAVSRKTKRRQAKAAMPPSAD
jgi:Ion channel